MKKHPSTKHPAQRVTAYLLYADVAKAMRWLAKAFGLREFGERLSGADGTVQHAAMKAPEGDETIMMGSPGKKYKNPKKLGSVTQLLYVNVSNVDKHFARAKKAGAKIIEVPTDQFYGDRRYGAVDPEGHQWYFAQMVKQLSRGEIKAAAKKRA